MSTTSPASPGLDPFGTAGLRSAVLDAWTASPARFREDANAEEDLLRGGYRDRWLVELAQNAADAAARQATAQVRADAAHHPGLPRYEDFADEERARHWLRRQVIIQSRM